MKNLNTFVSLVMLPILYFFFSKRVFKRLFFTIISSCMITPLSLQAVSISCPGEEIKLGDTTGTLTVNDSLHYYQYAPVSDGNLTISFRSTNNKTLNFYVGTEGCGSNNTPKYTESLSGTVSLLVSSTDDNISIIAEYFQAADYIITLTFSTKPKVSISPTAKEITIGNTFTELDVNLSEVGNQGDINVTYDHNCITSASSGVVVIKKGTTSETISIDTSELKEGDSCIVTLSNPVGIGNQDVDLAIAPDTSTITVVGVPDDSADLSISKKAFQGGSETSTILINSEFQYEINIVNLGLSDAENIVVTDKLPMGVTINNINSTDWSCSVSLGTVTCDYTNADMSKGDSSKIILNVTAPSWVGNINNTAKVSSSNDTITSNNSDSVDVKIVDSSKPSDLCYTNSIGASPNSACLRTGNLYYLDSSKNSKHCTASVDIVNLNTGNTLQNIIVYKLYDPGIDKGKTCVSIDPATCIDSLYLSSEVILTGYENYSIGHKYDLTGSLDPEHNVTIVDYDTYHSISEITGSILYAKYTKVDDKGNELLYTGKLSACSSGNTGIFDSPYLIDAVDYYSSTTYTDTNGPDIRTKISEKDSQSLTAVLLDDSLTVAAYYPGLVHTKEDDVEMWISFSLADTNCNEIMPLSLTNEDNISVRTVIEVGSPIGITLESFETPEYIIKDARILMHYLDNYRGYAITLEDCMLTSSTGGNMLGINACGNSENKLVDAYGDAAIYCLDYNDMGFGPCSSNYGTGTDIIEQYPDKDWGCYQCLMGQQPTACSIDHFAIRPNKFDSNITSGIVLTAGKSTNLEFTALTHDDKNSTRYNEDEDDSFKVDINISDLTKECQRMSIEMTPEVNFIDGYDNDNFIFNDIGDVNMTIHEINGFEFALIDANDTLDDDRLITPFIIDFRIIPDHFNIGANLSDHNTDNNFTYLHNINEYEDDDNYSMAAALTMDILAMGEDDNITHNYTETCYAKDTNVTLALGGTNITYPGTIPALTKFIYYNPVEDNGTNDGEGEHNFTTPITSPISIASLPIENIDASFPTDAPDGNGTTRIKYKLNFDRKQNLVVNPFKMLLSDVNISDEDDVTGSATETAGTVSLDQNATMYYARTRSSKFFYEDITDTNVTTPILVDVYCNFIPTSGCDTLDNIDTVSGAIDDINWYISRGHTSNDGNITLMVGDPLIEGTGSPTVNGETNPTPTDITNWGTGAIAGADDTVNVAINGSNVPLTVPIELVRESDTPTPAIYTNEWLIYNPNDPIPLSPFYKVRFIGDSEWTGEGGTGHVVDINASYKKTKRLDW